ncbi:ATP synthase F1 subunit epsilon [Candidatus Roizmanbacteria bacterium RIFCSPHIGHO2_12_FULL_41_11]|uniref:ATP synthase epsilon chain n=1 Tax=Candidatus Roizmanbacteria bacterium RIFCSPHIGHO2_12_FULL_41_11 TaxID=1802052 RepID=A0A1F7I426_9BACT|nr:MAG: ATP synthase F1 subunit epsilon [Candidatus Roizmanbacteria bacterium RIFCSPHIGHO2_12_FULL_41_11]
MLKLQIITPTKKVVEREIDSVTVPTEDGEITILPRHANLFTLLSEGIITMRDSKEEEYMAIGGGYLETDGKQAQILVSRAFKQQEIDAKLTQKALEEARQILKVTADKTQRTEAVSIMRRSLVNLKLLKKRKRSATI